MANTGGETKMPAQKPFNPDETSGAMTPCWNYTDPNAHPDNFSPLREDLNTDVCVIGAGIAGLSVAYHLVTSGRQVVLIDDGDVGSGETGRTSAHLAWALDDHYSELVKYHGAERARMAYESHLWAIEDIERISKAENIECEFQRLNAYLFEKTTPSGVNDTLSKQLAEELKACRTIGIDDVYDVDRAPISGYNTGRAIVYPRQGQFHPTKYIHGLARAIAQRGGRIYTHSKVVDLKGGSNATVHTQDGYTVHCQNIVMATGAPLQKVTVIAKLEADRTYIVCGVVNKGDYERALYYDTEEPYHYVRFCDYNDTQDLIIVGGEDHEVGRETDMEERFARLEQWTRERFTKVQNFPHRWSGQVFEPIDMLQFVGHNPHDHKNVFVVTGDSGNGLTMGAFAGKLIRDLIVGEENPWASTYSPSRLAVRSMPEEVKHFIEMNIGYKKWLQTGDVSDIEEIPCGQGAVIKDGLKPIAVYRDETGKTFKCSAICTHMQGVVQWNKAEKSWDCPVHGSRFDCKGKAINGPACADLAPVE